MIDLLREYWDWFLFDTLIWTGALIALVMVLRHPVAKAFGAGAAYALWFLPLARLVIPPFTLPAWMRPIAPRIEEAAPQADAGFAISGETLVMPIADTVTGAPAVLATPIETPIDFLTPLLLLWLGGALFMLVRRFWLYFELRRELLDDARPVGEVGSIRLIETSAISGPMAFGVIDRVIALPSGFMTSRDRAQRDLAIEHELAHHRGGDLLVNMAVQPLFSIHWFNPLGWLGWHALRRDQEAYCDARVVASRTHEERAAYAGIIADFARLPALAPRPALAAPMACPVLGDKSIIHRLRSLSMSDVSPRRRLTGRVAIAAAFLAVPMTASICYAEGAPKLLVAAAQAAEVDSWTEEDVRQEEDVEVIVERELAEAERELAEVERELEEARHEIIEVERELAEDGEKRKVRRVVRISDDDWKGMSEEDRANLREELAELRAQFAEGGEFHMEMEKVRKQFAERGELRQEIVLAVQEAQAAGAEARANAPRVVVKCVDKENVITTDVDSEGKTVMFVCEANADRMAFKALKSARAAIATERNLTDEQRAEALRAIDEELAELKSES